MGMYDDASTEGLLAYLQGYLSAIGRIDGSSGEYAFGAALLTCADSDIGSVVQSHVEKWEPHDFTVESVIPRENWTDVEAFLADLFLCNPFGAEIGNSPEVKKRRKELAYLATDVVTYILGTDPRPTAYQVRLSEPKADSAEGYVICQSRVLFLSRIQWRSTAQQTDAPDRSTAASRRLVGR